MPTFRGDMIGPISTSNAENVESQYMKFHSKYAFILSPSDGLAARAADVLVGGFMVRSPDENEK
jgi:hypothetical protein